MKHELVKWLCFDLIIGLMWVRTLVNPKLNSLFVKIYFGMKVKGHGNPNWPRSSQGWLKNRCVMNH